MAAVPPAGLPPDPRILLVRLSALGDLVFALPALQALRHLFPQARIAWLAEDRCAALPRSHPEVDETLVFPRGRWRRARGPGAHLRALGELADHFLGLRKHGRFDLVLDLQGNLKSALHLLCLRAGHTLGLDRPASREGARFFVRQRVPDPGRVHRVERDLALVRALGWTGPPPAAIRWVVETQAARDVDLRLGHFLAVPEEAREGGPLVLLHTEVTAYGRDKAWPEERWLALARILTREHGARVLLLWDESSRLRVLRRVEAAAGHATLAPPTPSLEHLMALTDRAALVVGTDSGPVHLAAYRGTPVLCLHGPTDPQRYRPWGPRVRVLHALPDDELPPPRDRSRPSPLMARIPVAEVAAAAGEMLQGA